MATIDTSEFYLLTNSYSGAGLILAVSPSDSSTLTMSSLSSDSSYTEWFFTLTDISPFYRLHTVSGGLGEALDVVNDAGTSSINLHMTSTGQYSGQYWRLDPWPASDAGGGYQLSNNFTGLAMHLDVYSDTLQPHLANGDTTGQHWTLNIAPDATATSSPGTTSTTAVTTSNTLTTTTTTAITVVESGPSTSTSTSLTTATAQGRGAEPLSAGQITGIAVGGIAVLAIVAGMIAFMLAKRAKATRRHTGVGLTTDDKWVQQCVVPPPPPYYSGAWRAELGGEGRQSLPVELPLPQSSELPSRQF